MKTVALGFTCMLMIACGCSTMHQVDIDQPDQWMNGAQHNLLNREATVITADGSALEGKIIKLNSDSLLVQLEQDNTLVARRLDGIRSIKQARSVFPAIGGLLGGAIVGAFVGASIGTSSEPPRADMLGFNTVASGLDGIIIGGLVGGVGGMVGLGLATSVDDYQFIQSQLRKTVPGSGPATSDAPRKAK